MQLNGKSISVLLEAINSGTPSICLTLEELSWNTSNRIFLEPSLPDEMGKTERPRERE